MAQRVIVIPVQALDDGRHSIRDDFNKRLRRYSSRLIVELQPFFAISLIVSQPGYVRQSASLVSIGRRRRPRDAGKGSLGSLARKGDRVVKFGDPCRQ